MKPEEKLDFIEPILTFLKDIKGDTLIYSGITGFNKSIQTGDEVRFSCNDFKKETERKIWNYLDCSFDLIKKGKAYSFSKHLKDKNGSCIKICYDNDDCVDISFYDESWQETVVKYKFINMFFKRHDTNDNSSIFDDDKVSSLLCQYQNIFNLLNCKKCFFYFIPPQQQRAANDGMLYCSFSSELRKQQIVSISYFISGIFMEDVLYRLDTESIKSAVAAIMSRNMSHNLGSHVISGTKSYISNRNYDTSKSDNKGIYRLFQYLQERMDFVSVIINSAQNPYTFNSPLNLKSDILDEIAADGRDKRHPSKDATRSFLLDYIVKSENVSRKNVPGKIESKYDIEITLLRKEFGTEKLLAFSSEANGDNNTSQFNNINFSIPFGINSRHALLTIIENFIRNSAKHNNSVPGNNTLLISILIEDIIRTNSSGEEIEKYKITIFDNKKQSNKEIEDKDGQKIVIQSNKYLQDILKNDIRILDNFNKLDTSYKGIKEMLLCSAWMQNKKDWRLIESKNEHNTDLLKYELINLSEKYQELDSNKVIQDYYKDFVNVDEALGISFELPKHKYVHIQSLKKLFEFENFLEKIESADYYVITDCPDFLERKIKYALPRAIIYRGAAENLEITENTEKALLACYRQDHKKDINLLINYDKEPVIHEQELLESEFIREKERFIFDFEDKNRTTCLFINHNDMPDRFADNYDLITSKYGENIFIEGISGASYNYNLLINAPLKELDYYKISESCKVKIGILDERLYEKYQSVSYTKKEIDSNEQMHDKNIRVYREKLDQGEIKPHLDGTTYFYIANKIGANYNDTERILKWLENRTVPSKTYNQAWLNKKNIYIYNIEQADNPKKIISIDGGEVNQQEIKNLDFLSIHYGIVEKVKLENPKGDEIEIFKQKLSKILENLDIIYNNKSETNNTRLVIHSGRGGVAEIQQDLPFLPVSIIESQLDDCKYKLAQLFLNLKYKRFEYGSKENY